MFGKNDFSQLILLFSLFLLLFMDFTLLFITIHGSHCTISVNFYLYLQLFQQNIFSFSKINRSQIDLECAFDMLNFVSLFYYSTYFCYYSWDSLHFLILFMSLTVLF